MIKGTSSAIGGLVFKPLSGGLDLVVKGSEGVKNTLKVFDA